MDAELWGLIHATFGGGSVLICGGMLLYRAWRKRMMEASE